MQFEKIHNKGQAQLFKNPYLEMLTKTHPLVIWGMYTPVMIYMLYYSGNIFGFSTTRIILTFLGGMFFWSFFEYIAHRFLFHMVANSGRAKKFVYTLHGNHHHYPRDRQRLFMPPVSKSYSCICYIRANVLVAQAAYVHVLSRISFRLSYVWDYALCYSCMESAFQMDERIMEKSSSSSL
jgi:hypothetical protein